MIPLSRGSLAKIRTSASANSTSTAPTPTCRCRAGWFSWPNSTICSCTRTPTSTRSSACSSSGRRRASCGRTRASTRPERVAEMLRKHKNLWADLAFRTDHASGGKVDPAWRAPSCSFPTASWSAPTPYVPSAGTTSPSTPTGRARWLADLPRDVAERIAWQNGEACSSVRCYDAAATRYVALLVVSAPRRLRARARRPTPASKSPRFVLAFKPEPISVAQHFALDVAVCAKSAAPAANAQGRRAHAGAPARHELRARGEAASAAAAGAPKG